MVAVLIEHFTPLEVLINIWLLLILSSDRRSYELRLHGVWSMVQVQRQHIIINKSLEICSKGGFILVITFEWPINTVSVHQTFEFPSLIPKFPSHARKISRALLFLCVGGEPGDEAMSFPHQIFTAETFFAPLPTPPPLPTPSPLSHVQLLLEWGADIYLKNKVSKTALELTRNADLKDFLESMLLGTWPLEPIATRPLLADLSLCTRLASLKHEMEYI